MIRHMGDIVYVDDQADGAWNNGTRIVKTRKIDAEEVTAVGAKGIILGSMAMPEDAIAEQLGRGLEGVEYGYFVLWDDKPSMPTFCIDKKLGLIQ